VVDVLDRRAVDERQERGPGLQPPAGGWLLTSPSTNLKFLAICDRSLLRVFLSGRLAGG